MEHGLTRRRFRQRALEPIVGEMSKKRWRDDAAWCALGGGAVWVASTVIVSVYYPNIHAHGMPRALALAWMLGAIATVIGSLLAIPKWQSVFGLLATLFVLWMLIVA